MSTVISLTAECFNGSGTAFDAPTWQDVDNFLRKLDGDSWWMVGIEAGDGQLVFEGGLDGNMLVAWSSVDADEHYVAVRPDAKTFAENDVIAIGGQTSEAEARHCLQLETALACARWFFDHGTRSPQLEWEPPQ